MDAWKHELPRLPDERKASYIREFGLTSYVAEQLVSDRALADYFEQAAKSTHAVKTLGNLMLTEVFRLLDSEGASVPIAPEHMAQIATMAENNAINSGAAKKLIAALWLHDEDPAAYAQREHLLQLNDPEELRAYVVRAIAEHPDMVDGYRRGKQNLKKALMGAAMAQSSGRANPVLLQHLMDEALDGIPS